MISPSAGVPLLSTAELAPWRGPETLRAVILSGVRVNALRRGR